MRKPLSSFAVLSLPLVMLFLGANAQEIKTKLFNGKNLNAWYAYVKSTGKHLDATEVFSVEDGNIKFSGDENGYLMSLDTFRNFHLIVEYKWETNPPENKKSKTKNSGIMYHIPFDVPDTFWPKGIQFQVKEGFTGDFVLLDNVTIQVSDSTNQPGKSVVMKRFADAEKPIGEWNTVEIISENGVCIQKLNGKLVNEGKNASVNSGRILLQYEGYPIYFRKVEVVRGKRKRTKPK
jgi:hypothetical protein